MSFVLFVVAIAIIAASVAVVFELTSLPHTHSLVVKRYVIVQPPPQSKFSFVADELMAQFGCKLVWLYKRSEREAATSGCLEIGAKVSVVDCCFWPRLLLLWPEMACRSLNGSKLVWLHLQLEQLTGSSVTMIKERPQGSLLPPLSPPIRGDDLSLLSSSLPLSFQERERELDFFPD